MSLPGTRAFTVFSITLAAPAVADPNAARDPMVALATIAFSHF